MPCYAPLHGYRARDGSGRLVQSRSAGWIDIPLEVPCGRCIGCRLERSRQWAVRCVHEASLYSDNCFITLTYDDEHLPVNRSLDKSVFQKFMKRLRKRFVGTDVVVVDGVDTYPIRYFHCGEYGERFGRPHYHACLFNFDFKDKVPFKETPGGTLYVSSDLFNLWPFGFSTVGAVTFESAAYVARYVMKKITGSFASEHYTYIDEGTGEFYEILPEYTTMSLKPGIGSRWLDKFSSDVFPDDFVVMRGVKMSPPRYYRRRYEVECPKEYLRLQDRRLKLAVRRKEDNTRERLEVREKVAKARISIFSQRNVDKET